MLLYNKLCYNNVIVQHAMVQQCYGTIHNVLTILWYNTFSYNVTILWYNMLLYNNATLRQAII